MEWLTKALSNKIAELEQWEIEDLKDQRILRGLSRLKDQLTKK